MRRKSIDSTNISKKCRNKKHRCKKIRPRNVHIKYHKYQIAFDKALCKENFDIDFISYSQDGRVIKVVVKEEYDEFSNKINKYNPLIIDEISIDFEELFMIEVESRGYLK